MVNGVQTSSLLDDAARIKKRKLDDALGSLAEWRRKPAGWKGTKGVDKETRVAQLEAEIKQYGGTVPPLADASTSTGGITAGKGETVTSGRTKAQIKAELIAAEQEARNLDTNDPDPDQMGEIGGANRLAKQLQNELDNFVEPAPAPASTPTATPTPAPTTLLTPPIDATAGVETPPAAVAATNAELAAASAAADAVRVEAGNKTGAASTLLVAPTAPPRGAPDLDVPNIPVGTPLTPEIATALTSFVNESLLAAPTVAGTSLLSAGAATTGPKEPRVNMQPQVLRTGIQNTLLTGLTATQQYAGRGVRRTLLGTG